MECSYMDSGKHEKTYSVIVARDETRNKNLENTWRSTSRKTTTPERLVEERIESRIEKRKTRELPMWINASQIQGLCTYASSFTGYVSSHRPWSVTERLIAYTKAIPFQGEWSGERDATSETRLNLLLSGCDFARFCWTQNLVTLWQCQVVSSNHCRFFKLSK